MIDRGIYRQADDGTKRLLVWAEEHGWSAERSKGDHIRLTHPCGGLVFHSLTTGDKYSWLRARSQLRQEMLSNGMTKDQVK